MTRRECAAAVLLALACAACDSKHGLSLVPDQPPTVTLTSGPIDTLSAPQSWLVDIAWVGTDPDGRIDHYEYAIDPPSGMRARFTQAETAWVSTNQTHVLAHFRAATPDTLGPGATASDFHTFILRAFDDRGGASALLVRAFYAYTVAPDVQITRPLPSIFFQTSVPVPFRAEWTGHDPDGTGSGQPSFYRSCIVDLSGPDRLTWLLDPDSLLRLGAANDWAGWTSADTPSRVIQIPEVGNRPYVGLAVVAVDEAGATTPYLLFDRNFLMFSKDNSEVNGPRIEIRSPLVDFSYQSGGYSTDPLREIPVQAGTGTPLEFSWDAIVAPGRRAVSSRWMLDGDPFDPASRSDPTDLAHWTALLPAASNTVLPPLTAGVHRFYVEVDDDFDQRSLAIVRIDAIDYAPSADLLVVDDTRLEPDRYSTGRLNPYLAPWPSAAELDTFLYARGGVPWRAARNPPDALSPAGLLAGYAFDTLGTSAGLADPAQAVPLSTLSRYRHVLWIVDVRSARQLAGSPAATALLSMSAPGLASSLAAYVSMGGEVWLAGGGGAYASLIGFNKRANDTCGTLFTSGQAELGPGRPLYDFAHVRSALTVSTSNAQPDRSPAARGGWTGQGPDGTLSAPDYAKLPSTLHFRTPGTDPLPPARLASQGVLYYATSSSNEYVTTPDTVAEQLDPSRYETTLDTLYDVADATLCLSPAPAMLYYHGRQNAPFVFTGFDLWSWTRSDCQALVDFVLGDIWKLPKSAPGVRPGGAPPKPVQRPATTRVSARLDPHRRRP